MLNRSALDFRGERLRDRVKAILFALGALVVLAGAANAQLSNLTQAPVPLGGSDTRGLPYRAALPPMFGTNLFRTGPLTSFGVMPGSATIATSGGAPILRA
jgi:hypothetical protein